MKYHLTSLLLAVILLLSLVSCVGEKAPATTVTEEKPFVPASASELWEKADSVMDELASYGMKQEIKLVFYASGNKFVSDSSADAILSHNDEDFFSYIAGTNHIVCEALSVDETTEIKEAFYDGKMYCLNKGGDIDQRLCSPISAEKYKEDFQEDSLLEDADFDDCMRKDFSKQEDGTWKLTFSGYTKKTLGFVMKDLDLDDELLGADVLDMDVALTADAEFRVKELEIKFLFDLEENSTTSPEFSMKATYDRYNEAKFDFATLLPEEYTEVDDLLILDEFEEGLEEYKNAKKGKFLMTSKTDIKFLGQTNSIELSNDVTYGEENGSYYYDIKYVVDDESMQISFRGGVQTMTVEGGESESYVSSEEEARIAVDNLIDSAAFTKELVTDVEKSGDDTYLIKIANLDEKYWSALLAEEEIEYGSGSQEISVTIKEGKIKQYSANFIIQGVVREGLQTENVVLTIQKNLVFEEAEFQKGA